MKTNWQSYCSLYRIFRACNGPVRSAWEALHMLFSSPKF